MQAAVVALDHRSPFATIFTHVWVKRLLLAIGMSLVFSTQLLFQESVFEHFSLGETLESMTLYFLDLLTIAILMVCAVSIVDAKLPAEGGVRNVALSIAVVGAVLAGIAIQMVVHYGSGPYPSTSYMLGEAARWTLMGGAITSIYEAMRRHRRHQQQLHQAELRHKILDNQMIEARIKMMEAQIEPHFLFNTLATVKRLYRTEPTGGARMVARLKKYLQAALPQIRRGIPTLASEIELVRAYLEILRIRMGSRLEFTIDAPRASLSVPFPAMVLITLVENSIKHGLNPMPHGGCIDIRVFDSTVAIAVEVRDNGVGFQVGAGTSGSGIGLANIRSRLAALYDAGASMVLLQNDPAGVIARVEIVKTAANDFASDANPMAVNADPRDERAPA